MNQKFVGGLYRRNGSNSYGFGMDIGVPWILLIPTEEKLEFRVRLGLQRFFGPWTVERQSITKVFRMRRGLTFPWPILRIEGQQDLQWTFRTYEPVDVLGCLEELGYPVDREFW
jgi:hypothetical protein